MLRVEFRKVKIADKDYFAKWWRDKELIRLTSGDFGVITDKEVEKYFGDILKNKIDYHYMIILGEKVIGHISLAKRRGRWYETQIVIGEEKYRGKGYGSEAIKLLIQKVKRLKISKIYLEVRPTNLRAIKAYERVGFRKVKVVSYPKNKFLPKTIRMELESEQKRAGDVIDIDEVEYLISQKAIEQFEKGEELMPIKRLVDKKMFMVSRGKFEKSKVVDHLK